MIYLSIIDTNTIAKNKIKGKRTRNQENEGAPALHIKFRIHVQNNT